MLAKLIDAHQDEDLDGHYTYQLSEAIPFRRFVDNIKGTDVFETQYSEFVRLVSFYDEDQGTHITAVLAVTENSTYLGTLLNLLGNVPHNEVFTTLWAIQTHFQA